VKEKNKNPYPAGRFFHRVQSQADGCSGNLAVGKLVVLVYIHQCQLTEELKSKKKSNTAKKK
jgi:hypothetical protein